MGDTWRGSLNSHLIPESRRASERGQDDDPLGLQSTVYESRRVKDLDDAGLGADGQEEEIPPEEVAGEEPETQNPEEALFELERVLDKGLEDDVPEMSRLSITQRLPSTSMAKGRKRRRLFELAKPKPNWKVLKDRMGCRCKGYAWISPCKMSLQFCLYWPSVYWTERFLEDTTLAITVPAVSRRVDELARPRRFYLEYYNNNRTTPVWPISRPTLEYQASSRLKELATPKMRNNIWSINMSEVSRVSRAAQMAVPSQRILRLSKPRAQATLLEEWDPMPKPRPHASDYNRLLHLAMPKAQSDKCVPDRDPRWEVLEVTKKAVASPRIISLAQPKVRKELNEGYNRHLRASMSLPPPRASPKKYDQPLSPLRPLHLTLHLCLNLYLHLYLCLHLCPHLHLYLNLYLCLYTYNCNYTYTCTYTYAYTFTCAYTCTHTFS
ncbi:sperm microtubule associated protein 2 [Eulemur rufifrons]|uniref:sperm microtubule associated protein 2 n=1 Tax=Eulemur rufifrons TaxID=859984 RepID=UPI0037424122